MPTTRWSLRAAALLTLTLLPFAAWPDVGPGLYVSETGVDGTDCTNVEQPCATISYALGIAEKNTRIHVAEGRYDFGSAENILYAMSGAVHVHGGYIEDDQGQWIKGGTAYLTSIPPGYRSFFSTHGFVVIADSKGDEDYPESAALMLGQFQAAQLSAPAASCSGGFAAGFECNNVDLLSKTARQDFRSTPMSLADVWGFTDLNTRREYVIVGAKNGTAVFDVTDAAAPREIGFVGGQSASWRDMKVYQFYDPVASRYRAYAYVTTDGASDGLVVIDLSGLPHRIARIAYASDFQNAHNVYLTDTDYGTGVALNGTLPQLIVAGSGIDNGQFRTYSLGNPAAPAFVQRVAGAGYMHDASSQRITDSRADSCPGASSCNVLFDFNEEDVALWNISNPSFPVRLATVPEYPNRGYVHSGWWTEDQRYLFVHDELDERSFGLPTTLRVVSLDNLEAPSIAGQWTGAEASVDHNGFVRGNRYYMSTYTSGLKILDISEPTQPVEVGMFDTYPTGDTAIFAGAWGAYPYLPSGTIAVSDINSGLYLLDDKTRDVAAGSFGFTANSFAQEEGQVALLEVRRSGGSAGSATVRIEAVAITASGDDFDIPVDIISWPDGDSEAKLLPITVLPDALDEGLEELIVRLVDPQGGATLGHANSTSLFISDVSAATEIDLLDRDIVVPESGNGVAVLTVQRLGSASGAASADFTVSSSTAVAGNDFDGPAAGTLEWANGDGLPKTIVFEILENPGVESIEGFEVTLSNVQGGTLAGSNQAAVTILDGEAANTPPVAAGGPDQTRLAGSNIMLNGAGSFDPDGDALTYLWTQESGPGVSLRSANSDSATFVAPAVSSNELLRFRLTVTDSRGLSAETFTTVTLTPRSQNTPGRGGSGSPAPLFLVALLLTFALQCRRQQPVGNQPVR